MRFLHIIALMATLSLSACGGGGGSSGSVSGGDSGGSTGTALATSASSSLTLAVGDTQSFQISGGKEPYTISSSDVRVVSVVLTSPTYMVKALKSGSSTLTISDSANTKVTVLVTINSAAASTEPATIDIVSSNNSLPSSAVSKLILDVTVKDASSVAIPGAPVTFKASSGTLIGANPVPITSANGVASVTLSPGADPTNRDIEVTVTSGSISKTIVIPVTGSTISIAGAGSTLLSATPLTYSIKATDSAGKSLANAAVAVTSSIGNTVSPSTVVTNSSGLGSVSYTPRFGGKDILRAVGLGASASAEVTVSGEDFTFVAPVTPVDGISLPTNIVNLVTVRYKLGGVGVAGKSVTFSTTRGSVTAPTVITDVNGDATTGVISSTAGPVTISAQLDLARSTLAASFVSTDPATIVLQANPSAIFPNPTGTSANQSTMSVIVRDKDGNPVAGQVVNFSAIKDGSNGTITPGTSTTDKNGTASVQFIAGPLSTAANGIKLQASLQKSPSIQSTANLTVNGEALFISIGLGNLLIANADNVTYEKEMTVYVTDASGSPAVGRTITLSVLPTQYRKGNLKRDITLSVWEAVVSATCPNEDRNADGVLQGASVGVVTEDTNGNGRLDPGLPVVVAPGTVVTDSAGFGAFKLRYGKNYAEWVDTVVTARSLVGGTESTRSIAYPLQIVIADAKAEAAPASVFSPFGSSSSCSDPL